MKTWITLLILSISCTCLSQEEDTTEVLIGGPDNVITANCGMIPCPGLKVYLDQNIADIKEYELTIFNRWGEIIFESKDPEHEWRPWVDNDDLQDGVYIWQVKYIFQKDDNGDGLMEEEEIANRGHVTYLK